MAGPQDIKVQVEADAAAATRSTKMVADELTRVVSNVAALEGKLRGILTGQLPAQMKEFAQFIKTVDALPAQMSRVANTAKTLASGGPATQLNRATFQGALAGLKTDSSLQALTYEKEVNKVLAARETIYNRMRDAQPGATSGTAGYRAGLQSMGDDGGADRKGWMARTLAESKTFEAARTKVIQDGAMASARIDADFEDKLFNKRSQSADRNMRAEALRMNRAFSAKQTDYAKYERAEADYENRQRNRMDTAADNRMRAEANRENKQRSAPTADQKTAASLQTVKDRFNYQGGAGMLQVQASVLRNYAVVGAVLGSLSYIAKTTTEFQASMKDVQAISTATDTSMRALTKTIFEVGSTTKLSMSDLADGVKILAQAGYSVQQIQQMIKPISELAVGSGSTLEQATNVTTSVLSVFDLSVTRTAEVTNTLVAGLNQSKLSMEQLSLGIQYAGNIAAQGGVQFDELVAALGAASNAGIKSGATLGTGLRSVIVELENPTKKLQEALKKVHLTEDDVDIKTHGLVEVFKTLKAAGFDSAAAMGAMDIRAASMYAAISGNLDQFETYTHTINGTTAATDAAGTQMESFTAQWQRLLNAVTEFTTVGGGPVLAVLSMMTGGLADLFSSASAAGPAIQVLVAVLVALAAVKTTQYLVGLTAGFVSMARGALAAQAAAVSLTVAVDGLGAGLLLIGSALVIPVIIAALAGLILYFGNAQGKQAALSAEIEKFRTKASDAAAQSTEYQQRMREIDKTIELLTNRHVMLSQNVAAAAAEAEKAQGRFGAWGLQLDASGRNVDSLIGKLIKLRGEMAAVARQKAVEQDNALAGQQGSLKSSAVGQAPKVQAAAAYLLKGNNNLTSAERASLASVAAGNVTLDQLNQTTGLLEGAQARLGEGGRRFNGFLAAARPLASTQSQRIQLDGQRKILGKEISTTGIDASPQGLSANAAINSTLTAWRTRAANISQIKDPAAKTAAQSAEDARRQTEFAALKTQLGGNAASLMNNPQIVKGLTGSAALEGTSVQDQIFKQFDLGPLNSMAGTPDQMDEGQLRATAGRLNAEAATAKKGKDLATYKAKRDKAGALLKQADYMKVLKGGEEGAGAEGIVNDNAAAFDEQTKRGMMGGAGSGRAAANSAKRIAASDVKSLERQIDVAAANGGPGPEGIAANQDTLKALTTKWQAAKEEQIKAEATTTQEASQRLDDFRKFEAPKYIDAILNGNIQAAKDLLAKYAAEAADRTGAQSAAGILNGTKTLDEAMAATQGSFNDALAAALDASDQKFRAQGFNPATAHDAVEERRKINSDFVQKALSASLDNLQAQSDVVARSIQGQQLASDGRRAGTAALSNFYGSRNLSDVRRYLGGVANQHEDIGDAGRDVQASQAAYDQKAGEVSATAAALAKDPNNADLQKNLNAAQLDAEKLQIALAKSKLTLKGMTDEIAPFASLTDAATASWQAYADQAGLSKAPFEQVADGLTGVFSQAHQSFATLVTDVMSGSKTMGGAIKGFAVSVLQSMLDMAAQMFANQAMKFVLGTLFSALSGGVGNTMSAPQQSVAVGGLIRMAGGGPTPNRDSVHILAEPGEFMMRKSAVDFVGRDNLEQMNSMGNRRMSAMPTMASTQRKPDTTNVYIVSPEHQPQLGPKDIIQVVSQDMLTGGQTKKLVKAIMMGAG